MSYFQCRSVTVSTIYCFNPKLKFFVRNWVLMYINEKRSLSIRPSYGARGEILDGGGGRGRRERKA